MFLFRLVGNSLEIGYKTKMRFLGGELEKFSKKTTGYFRKKVGFWVLSWFFQGNQGQIQGQFASDLHLHLISGDYGGYMWVL